METRDRIDVRKRLDRTRLLEAQVHGTIHDAHATGADPLEELQAIGQRMRRGCSLQQAAAHTRIRVGSQNESAFDAFTRWRFGTSTIFVAGIPRRHEHSIQSEPTGTANRGQETVVFVVIRQFTTLLAEGDNPQQLVSRASKGQEGGGPRNPQPFLVLGGKSLDDAGGLRFGIERRVAASDQLRQRRSAGQRWQLRVERVQLIVCASERRENGDRMEGRF